MPIPSLYVSRKSAQAWNNARAAGYGAVIGALAALFKTLGPLREAGSAGESLTERLGANLLEVAGAALAFALLCAGRRRLAQFHCAAAHLARDPKTPRRAGAAFVAVQYPSPARGPPPAPYLKSYRGCALQYVHFNDKPAADSRGG